MNIEDKDLAIKVFDHFFKKANITSIEICFYKDHEFCIRVKTKYIYVKNIIYYNMFLLTNDLICNSDDVCKFKRFSKNVFLLPKIPKEFKINLIEYCISNEVPLFIPFIDFKKIIIPKMFSLEELAIQADLES